MQNKTVVLDPEILKIDKDISGSRGGDGKIMSLIVANSVATS